MWELLAGSILAYFEINKGYRSKNQTLNLILPTIGLILIGHSILFFNDEIFHPSFYTLSPIVGVCLIIWFSDKNELITQMLSTKIFVGIGLISYSLYLWHYPIFVFYRSYSLGKGLDLFANHFYEKLLIIFILIIVSIFTYFFIERMFRSNFLSIKKLFQFMILNIILILVFIFFSLKTDGMKFRVPENLRNNITYNNIYSKPYLNCFARFNYKTMDFCEQKDFKKNIYLVGDSRSGYLLNDLNDKANSINYNLNNLSTPNGKLSFENTNLKQKILSKLNKINNSIIVINGVWNVPGEEYIFSNNLDNFIKLFKILDNNNNKIIFIQPIPVIDNPYGISHASMRLFRMIKDKNLTVKIEKK